MLDWKFRSLWATFLSLQGFAISSKDSSGVFYPNRKLLLDPTFSHLMDRAALTLCPTPAQALLQLLEPPIQPHTPWQLPAGTTTVCGLRDAVLALTCWSLGTVSSRPTLPLAASAQESRT